MTQTQQCDRILPLLTAPEVYQQKSVGHRYFVELASIDCSLQDDRAVPVDTQIVDVVVTQPSKDGIVQLLATCNWLKGYSIVSYSELSFDEAPF